MIIKVPQALYNVAKGNIDNFIRDIACCPRVGGTPFIRRRKKIPLIVKDYPNPFDPNTMTFIRGFKCTDTFRRWMHIDLAQNKDAIGLSMCHVPLLVEREILSEETHQLIKSMMPIVKFDFWGRLKVGKGEEFVLADIRQVIYNLSQLGFYFGLITFDRFQSLDSIQILRRNGYRVGNLSIDRMSYYLELQGVDVKEKNEEGFTRKSTQGQTNFAATTIKDLIYDDRLYAPTSTMWYPEDYLVEECINIQETKKGKVDHPAHYHSDVFQSVAGSATEAIVHERMMYLTESEQDRLSREDSFYKQSNTRLDKYLTTNLENDIYQESFDPRDL